MQFKFKGLVFEKVLPWSQSAIREMRETLQWKNEVMGKYT